MHSSCEAASPRYNRYHPKVPRARLEWAMTPESSKGVNPQTSPSWGPSPPCNRLHHGPEYCLAQTSNSHCTGSLVPTCALSHPSPNYHEGRLSKVQTGLCPGPGCFSVELGTDPKWWLGICKLQPYERGGLPRRCQVRRMGRGEEMPPEWEGKMPAKEGEEENPELVDHGGHGKRRP